MPAKKAALDLPDQLIVRYFRADELDAVSKVETQDDGRVIVTLRLEPVRTDRWRDLGGGLGFVPDTE